MKKVENFEVLKVAEAAIRDVGTEKARINTETMRKLGVVNGDVIEIEGKSIAMAVVWPGDASGKNKSVIRIDESTMADAGVAVDDKVRVKKGKAKKAKRITLVPTEPVRIAGGERYLATILKGRLITKGQTIKAEMRDNPITFIVTNTVPSGTIIPQMDTEIVLRKAKEEQIGIPHVTYEDIGGLKREVGMIRDKVELPLMHPELFEQLGIEPPKGVLIYGAPGTGKTLMVKALANEIMGLNFILLDPADIFYKFLGDSERNLREIFENAEKESPSVVFIDQIDLIAVGRDIKDEGTEKRVLAQLLALMDDFGSLENGVIVVGTTNRIDLLDESLKKRFALKIEIGAPDNNAREDILRVQTKRMPLATNVNLKELADKTDGFVGADIAALCKKAALHTIQRKLPKIEMGKAIPPNELEKLKVTMGDFNEALKSL